MNRLTFIRNIALFGLGASLTPWKLAGAEPTILRFGLPPASVHIPHGNFAASEENWIQIPELEVELKVESFSRNGLAAHSDDLTIFHFRKDAELILLSQKNGAWESVGLIHGIEFTNGDVPSLSNRKYLVALHVGSSYLSLSRIG